MKHIIRVRDKINKEETYHSLELREDSINSVRLMCHTHESIVLDITDNIVSIWTNTCLHGGDVHRIHLEKGE